MGLDERISCAPRCGIPPHPRSTAFPSAQRISSTGRNLRLTDWNPEDCAAWEGGNNRIARRNLLCTVAGDHVAFSIWSLWSVMALFMPASVYGFSTGDKLLLGTVATLVGGCAACRWISARNSAAIGHARCRVR